jgi:2-polyprenyl-3-methyl-5-hydroxy-6-metoxy-1,4-benzoquinol methylase
MPLKMDMHRNQIEDELFCLNFELKALSDLLIRGEAERWVYSFITQDIEKEHLERYKHALQFIGNRKVLDIACGCGYGSYFLAKNGMPNHITGVDISEDSIRYANCRYNLPNIERIIGNAETFEKPDYFDVVLSFETIEHLKDFESFLKGVRNSLVKGGKLLISTPIVPATHTSCKNPYHVIEWNFKDFHKLLAKYFAIDHVFLQSIIFKEIPISFYRRALRKLKRDIFRISVSNPANEFINGRLVKYNDLVQIDEIRSGYQLVECHRE